MPRRSATRRTRRKSDGCHRHVFKCVSVVLIISIAHEKCPEHKTLNLARLPIPPLARLRIKCSEHYAAKHSTAGSWGKVCLEKLMVVLKLKNQPRLPFRETMLALQLGHLASFMISPTRNPAHPQRSTTPRSGLDIPCVGCVPAEPQIQCAFETAAARQEPRPGENSIRQRAD